MQNAITILNEGDGIVPLPCLAFYGSPSRLGGHRPQFHSWQVQESPFSRRAMHLCFRHRRTSRRFGAPRPHGGGCCWPPVLQTTILHLLRNKPGRGRHKWPAKGGQAIGHPNRSHRGHRGPRRHPQTTRRILNLSSFSLFPVLEFCIRYIHQQRSH